MEQPERKLEEPQPAPEPTSQAESTPVPGKGAEVFPIPEKPARKGFFGWLFNPETGFGRFMRRLVQGIALVVGLVALGFVIMYFWLYRPLQAKYQADTAELATLRQTQSSLTQEVSGLRARSSTLEASFAGEQEHVVLLTVVRDATLARAELLAGDRQAAAAALERAKKSLTGIDGSMKQANTDLATTIRGRLDLALTEVSTDPDTAVDDLVILVEKLEEMEGLLFPGSN